MIMNTFLMEIALTSVRRSWIAYIFFLTFIIGLNKFKSMRANLRTQLVYWHKINRNRTHYHQQQGIRCGVSPSQLWHLDRRTSRSHVEQKYQDPSWRVGGSTIWKSLIL